MNEGVSFKTLRRLLNDINERNDVSFINKTEDTYYRGIIDLIQYLLIDGEDINLDDLKY